MSLDRFDSLLNDGGTLARRRHMHHIPATNASLTCLTQIIVVAICGRGWSRHGATRAASVAAEGGVMRRRVTRRLAKEAADLHQVRQLRLLDCYDHRTPRSHLRNGAFCHSGLIPVRDWPR
jgi:hypothetical protein